MCSKSHPKDRCHTLGLPSCEGKYTTEVLGDMSSQGRVKWASSLSPIPSPSSAEITLPGTLDSPRGRVYRMIRGYGKNSKAGIPRSCGHLRIIRATAQCSLFSPPRVRNILRKTVTVIIAADTQENGPEHLFPVATAPLSASRVSGPSRC